MSVGKLKDNEELYSYLVSLAEKLVSHGAGPLADEVKRASLFITGSSSEFLHEARLVLKRILTTKNISFTADEIEEMKRVLDQIQSALNEVGGV
jgi:hypothetical protein